MIKFTVRVLLHQGGNNLVNFYNYSSLIREHAEIAIRTFTKVLEPEHLLLASSKRVKGDECTLTFSFAVEMHVSAVTQRLPLSLVASFAVGSMASYSIVNSSYHLWRLAMSTPLVKTHGIVLSPFCFYLLTQAGCMGIHPTDSKWICVATTCALRFTSPEYSFTDLRRMDS